MTSVINNNRVMLCVLVGVALVAVSSAGFNCADKSKDCPKWKSNMGGNCRGQDYQYMLKHCPVTCEMCDEAKVRRRRGSM